MSTWTERNYKYIQGKKTAEISSVKFTPYSITENPSMFFGFNKKYMWVWIAPSFLIAGLAISNASVKNFDWGAILFSFGFVSLFLTIILLTTRKKRVYTKNLRALHKGREILMNDQSLLISVGELTRSEPNSQKHTNNGMIHYSVTKGIEYLEIPLRECRSFKANKHTFWLYPVDNSLQTFEITLGDWRFDNQMLTQFKEDLLKILPEEESESLK